MIKIGIIGCGKITEVRHAPEYFENPNCEITAFFDVVPEKAEALAKLYGGKVYASVEELLASDVDAVSVCVANRFHAEISIQALKAGKHVLCEKPMATTPEDCEAMVATAKEMGKYLMIGQNQRLAKAHVKAKELLDSGEMGEILAFETHFIHPGPEGWTGSANSWFFDKRTAQFGAMADLGVHKTDLLYYLTGKKIVKTSAVITTVDKRYPDGRLIDVDDNAFAIYTLENGVVGTMHVGWTNYGAENNSTKLYCKNGVIRLYDDPNYSLIVEKPDGTVVPYELDKLTSNKEQTTGGRTTTGVIDAFIDCIVDGHEPAISGESAMHAMKVIFANQASSISGKAEDVV
ncbi:MAG: Gfo/Idh/MocA family oxidoreductase [Oscillospiraceae bacterium]|nr:Gfo/Idh/MocA family oxidoreductase [Oscillospiraceae bacterium]